MTAAVENNVISFLQKAARRVPDRPALIFGEGERASFADLWERSDRISAGLGRAGLSPGDRVIVMIPMSLELYAVMLGLLKLGAVAVFVDPWIGRKQIAAFAAFADPRGFAGIGKSHLLRLPEGRLRRIPVTLTTGGKLFRWPARLSLGDLQSQAGDGRVHAVTGDDPALITFTSGSSGLPKGTNRTHRFLTAQHVALKHEFPVDDQDVDMPMFPVFALNNLALGIPSVVPQMDFLRVAEVDASVILRQMRDHGVTTSTASPPFFDRLATHVEAHPESHPRLRRILTGGAPVSDDQLRLWQRSFPETEILVVYGSTEAEPVAHIHAAERLEATNDVRPDSPGFCIGRPTDKVRTRVIRIVPDRVTPDDELDVAEHGIGELCVTGDHVCKDYFRNPDAVRENKLVEGDGTVWHRMGDTGYFDRRGRFWLVGRVHSTIVRGGVAVHPQMLEQSADPGDARIRRVAAVGLPDSELGERVVLVVETSAGTGLRDEVEERMKRSGLIVDDIVLTSEPLPVDPRHNSKIDYPRLRSKLQKQSGKPVSGTLTAAAPFPLKLMAYLAERFPLWGNAVLIVSYYSSNQFLARVLIDPGEPMQYTIHSLMGAIVLLCMFFHLRVFDEHKDFEEDSRHYPDRVLQRGVVTLTHLKVLGGTAIALELILGAMRGLPALTAVLIAFGFSVLMLKEFFVRAWLKRHFLFYAMSHMLIMPLFALTVFSFATGLFPWQAPLWFGVYAFVGFFVTLNWEVSRKIRAPEQEIDGVESYTKIFGLYGAAYVVLGVRVIDTALVAVVGWHLGLSRWFYAGLVVLFLVCLVGFLRYRFRTSPKTAKQMEIYAGMYIVAFDLILAIEIVRKVGIVWVGS